MIKKSDNKSPSFIEFVTKLENSLAEQERDIIQDIELQLREYDPIKTAAAFCGLSTFGKLQSNQIRIANLIHASLKFCTGNKEIGKSQVNTFFKLLENTSAGRHEDPAEDVFIANVCTIRGTFRVFEGNWEGSAFYLERFLDIVDKMPIGGRYEVTKQSVYALLAVSDIIAERSGSMVNTVTAQNPLAEIPLEARLDADSLCQKVRFTESDLKEHGIDVANISPFVFSMQKSRSLPVPSHLTLTDLDKRPILKSDSGDYYLMPQSVSTAVRSYVLSLFTTTEQDQKALTANLIKSYANLLQNYFILGSLTPPPPNVFFPIPIDNVFIQEFVIDVTEGRPLHFLFVFDGFLGEFNDWSSDWNTISGKDIELNKRIENARKGCSDRAMIKHGITLIVNAGWGRPFLIEHDFKDTEDWSLLNISIHDLCHISDYPKMNALDLWRLINAELKLKSLGGRIQNLNGLLNLFGWLEQNEWHIVPHERISKESLPNGLLISIPTNHIADIRMKARQAKDRKVISDLDGNLLPVMRTSGSFYFKEDEGTHIYGNLVLAKSGELFGACIGKLTIWWCKCNNPNRNGPDFRIWDGALRWLPKIDLSLKERNIDTPEIFEWQLSINNSAEATSPENQFKSTLLSEGRILTNIQLCPDSLFNRPDNSGETAMVKSFLYVLLATNDDELVNDIAKSIIPNKDAKNVHIFHAKTFNDYVAEYIPEPVVMKKIDDSNLRLGLGWLDGTKGRFLKIQGKDNCIKHLNGIVDKIWNELSEVLRKYGRNDLCDRLLINIEAVRKERSVWERTIRATLALHEDKNDILEVTNQEIGKLTASSMASRLLIEMAVCTCPEKSDEAPDELEISTLLAYALLMFYLGSTSDAIKAELYPAEVYVFCFRRNWKKSQFVLASMSNLTERNNYVKEIQEEIHT